MKIICIGRNYVAHARELENEVPEEPVFFMKPWSSLLRRNKPFRVPLWSSSIHHEIELVIRIDKQGKNILPGSAADHYHDIGLGIDFTARDIQQLLKAKGLPWEKAKAFDGSAVLGSSFLSLASFPDPRDIPFRLERNGQPVQTGNSGLMIFGFDVIVSYVSAFVTLHPGDLIYTGTPAGVGAVVPGDHLEGYLGNQKLLDFRIR